MFEVVGKLFDGLHAIAQINANLLDVQIEQMYTFYVVIFVISVGRAITAQSQ